MSLWHETTRVLEKKSAQYKLLCEKKDEYCNKYVNKKFSYEIKSYCMVQMNLIDYNDFTQTAWGEEAT